MVRKLESRIGVRLNTRNYIKTPFSDAVISVDYSESQGILEIEFRDNQKIYHYTNVNKPFYETILQFKELRDSQPELSETEFEKEYSIGKFVNQHIKPAHDFYELHLLQEEG